MELRVDPESKVPIYVQIEDQVRAMVAAGQLRPREQLPTIRQLATDLRVNYNTVARAYLELDRDGVISTRQGLGTFAAGPLDERQMARQRGRKLDSIVRASLEEARRLGYGAGEIAAACRRGLKHLVDQSEEG
jgi:GntR family transcriptional regulator